MKTGDKVIVMYAVIPADRWDSVKLPHGSFAKAFNVGNIEDLTQVHMCKGWGAMMAASVNKLALKLCPVAGNILNADKPL